MLPGYSMMVTSSFWCNEFYKRRSIYIYICKYRPVWPLYAYIYWIYIGNNNRITSKRNNSAITLPSKLFNDLLGILCCRFWYKFLLFALLVPPSRSASHRKQQAIYISIQHTTYNSTYFQTLPSFRGRGWLCETIKYTGEYSLTQRLWMANYTGEIDPHYTDHLIITH